MKLYFSAFILALSLNLLSACSKSKDSGSREKEYRGNLVELLDQFYDANTENNLSTFCDVKLKNAKYAIARDLEKYKEKIQAYNRNKNKNSNTEKLVQIGNFPLSYSEPENIPSAWIKESAPSWYDLVGYHRALIDGGAVDANWSYLNKQVRSIIDDDKWRILNWGNNSIEHSDEAQLRELLQTVETCTKDESCNLNNLNPTLLKWANTKFFYPYHFERIKSAKDKESLQAAKEKFLNRIKDDIFSSFEYDYVPNHQKDKATKTLTLRIDFSAFSPDQRKLSEYIEKAWSVFGFNLKIENEQLNPFSFFNVDISPKYVRASVRFNKHEHVMKISENVSINTLIHETGHAIGLEDKYYTLWNEDMCQYSTQFNSADIMSNSSTGRVLQENINRITEKYFK